MIEFLQAHATLLISILALCASLRAISLTHRSQKTSERLALVEAQTETMRELDLQHAKLGSLIAVTAEAVLIFSGDESLKQREPDGYKRVLSNLEAGQGLGLRYEEQRQLVESSLGQGNLIAQKAILSKIRQLTIHIEEDIAKETRYVESLKRAIGA